MQKPAGKQKKFWSRNAWKTLTLPFLLFLLIPFIALFSNITPSIFWSTLESQQVLQAMWLSLITTVSTVVLTIIFGTPVAYLLSRRRTPFVRFVDTLVDLPTVLPPAVAGVALLLAFGRQGLIGSWLLTFGVTIPFTPVAVIMAQMFVAGPLYIKAVTLGFIEVDCELRKAAAMDGANRWHTFRYVMVPISRTSILSGSVMTWARALGEFGATIIFAGNFPGRTQTMPLAIYIGFETDMNVAVTLSVILVCFSFFILFLVKGLLHQKMATGLDDSFD
jgi:molybdate transport system permease protein